MAQPEVIRCQRCDRCLAERLGNLLVIPHRGKTVQFVGRGVVQVECPQCSEPKRIEVEYEDL